MAGRRVFYLAVLLGCLVFYIFYRHWLSWMVLLLVILVPLFSAAVSLPAMLSTQMGIRAPKYVQLEEPAEAELMVRCAMPGPLFRGRLLIQRPMTGEQWRQDSPAQLPVEHCGGLRLRVISGYVYDYLGLFRLRFRREGTRSLVVRPRPVAPETPPDLTRYLARGWRPKLGGGFAENHELRLYRPGDNLRQIHWKLTAKTGKLILRESMEPERGRAILTMDLNGTPEELDRKLGRLLWLSRFLLEMGISHDIYTLTGNGVTCCRVTDEASMFRGLDSLLWEPCAMSGSIQDRKIPASWAYHVGGDTDEA